MWKMVETLQNRATIGPKQNNGDGMTTIVEEESFHDQSQFDLNMEIRPE